MSLILRDNSNGMELIPEGTYAGVCNMIVDNGTSFDEKWAKNTRRVTLFFEVAYEDERGNDKRGERCKSYNFSFNEKSSLRKDLEQWRGRRFTAQDLEGFDLRNILGVPCMIQVVHSEDSQGRTQAVIGGILSMPKGMPAIKPSKQTWVFDVEDSDLQDMDTLPEWLQDRIKRSVEYKQRTGATGATGTAVTSAPSTPAAPAATVPAAPARAATTFSPAASATPAIAVPPAEQRHFDPDNVPF